MDAMMRWTRWAPSAVSLERFGIETTNELNRAAVRDMAPIEVARLLKAIKLEAVSSFQELETFMTDALELLTGDYFGFQWLWLPPNKLRVQVDECFAYRGISRLGVIDRYECGLFERIHCWFDVLGIGYEVKPAVEHSTKHHDGTCAREYYFD